MDRKFFAGVLALILFTGCTAFESLEEKEVKYGKAPPVIEQSFASKAMEKGDTWKIYLKAYDPDGDLKTVLAYFERGGTGVPRPFPTPKSRKMTVGKSTVIYTGTRALKWMIFPKWL